LGIPFCSERWRAHNHRHSVWRRWGHGSACHTRRKKFVPFLYFLLIYIWLSIIWCLVFYVDQGSSNLWLLASWSYKASFFSGMVDVLQCILGFKTKRDLGCMSLSQLLFAWSCFLLFSFCEQLAFVWILVCFTDLVNVVLLLQAFLISQAPTVPRYESLFVIVLCIWVYFLVLVYRYYIS